MKINLAHINIQGVNCAVFEANSNSHNHSGRSDVLQQLTVAARHQGLRIEKSVLAYRECGKLRFFGTPDLVKYLANGSTPRWTHTITV